jgi:tRNA dimethylallyltransferase
VVRERLSAELATAGPALLHDRLTALDPVAAAVILPSDGRRIVRALEVIEISGQPFSATMPSYDSGAGPARGAVGGPAIQVGIRIPRPELDRRIESRVDRMFAHGLEREVRELADHRGLRDGRTASRALGYQQVLRSLDGDWTLEQARDETVRATRRFARRQESWFRRDPRVNWIDAGEDLPGRVLRVLDSVMSRRTAPMPLRPAD